MASSTIQTVEPVTYRLKAEAKVSFAASEHVNCNCADLFKARGYHLWILEKQDPSSLL
jgi:hypothetical protein